MKKKFLLVGIIALVFSVISYGKASNNSVKKSNVESWKPYDTNGEMIRTDRGAIGKIGVVSTSKVEASRIGADILKKGGNAIDAAVAAGFALGVVEPNSSGLGGGGFMLIRIAKTGETVFIDFRERAPQKASPEMWIVDADGKVVGNKKVEGGKAAAVPGEVAGLLYALEKYGTMSREQVIRPAVNLAKNGYYVTPTLSNDMKSEFDKLEKYPESAKVYLNKEGLPYEVGDKFTNKDLAKTLEIIIKKGKDGFYKGEVAQAIVKTLNKYDGLYTMEDLANYKPLVRKPVTGTYRGYEIISSPSPSSGGAIVIEILNILENFNVGELEVNSPEYLHLFSEAYKLAYADRAKYMGDSDYTPVPMKGFVSKKYAKEISKDIDMKVAHESKAHDPWLYESEDTTHYSIADKEGNMVAITKTVNGLFGNSVVVDGYGFVMNNEMDDFVVEAGHPNSVAPGKTPLSSMSPTIVLKDGKPFMVLGSPGATKIISTVSQVISRVIDHNMSMQDAIDTPRLWDNTSNVLNIESRIPDETVKKLEAMGHKVNKTSDWDRGMGSVQGVLYKKDGTLEGGADPRRDGKALGL
ncbi:gamma-glutamyltransferase [Fusobacterium nucleatum]|uniref:Glutathione hydrolase proenzyme n=2 Tax=Fusobacterium TaxID=848 RepID=A0A3P1V3T7_9FUSO|nr:MULTISPECIES: gamma-glutamyltransferase [Fusobacterium]PHH97398.1 gamma-glutamyltransferase [Fusobacterium polymorphum]QQB73270.1 gamma-glutamyltransferase [Fusobacterium canifelinum]QQS86791.1 gamma-glutamyltransferase [Fusobacterium canifelinum]RRD28854.1 gamma-glutamyltransferase [Fusobacterium canifelinum]